MKVIISVAVWGESYASLFARFSLATLLSPNNIPKLARQAQITFHIFTTRRDRKALEADPGIVELSRYSTIEWEAIEDFGVTKAPEGPGGEKYPFLSALQNLAITRSLDHDVIVFNYADFIWADGSLTAAIDMLIEGGEKLDAVFSFCIPVDRDSALPDLDQHRRLDAPQVIDLSPRAGAKVAIERLHREAKIRLWEETPRFTNLPSYLIWRVKDQGILLRAYHQSILAMRVRPDDEAYRRGILRGGLDSAFSAQLAERASCAFATDGDKILVFSLYHTPVDSRVPPGVTREMSLRSLLTGDVTPPQRRFAEQPIYLRLKDGNEADWKEVADASWRMLKAAQDETPFDQSVYDRNYETHGVIPKIRRLTPTEKLVRPAINRIARSRPGRAVALLYRAAAYVLSHSGDIFHSEKRPVFLRKVRSGIARLPHARRAYRIVYVLVRPPLLFAAFKRRVSVKRWFDVPDDRVESWLLRGEIEPLEKAFNWRASSFELIPNLRIERSVYAKFLAAVFVESMSARVTDPARLLTALRTAETLLRRAIAACPVWSELTRALGRNLMFQGRFDEAKQTFADAEKLRDRMAIVAGWPVDSCVYLPRNCAEVIGLMGHIDAFVKARILNGDTRPYYLPIPATNIVNPVFLDYWKTHVSVETQAAEIKMLAVAEPVYSVNWNWVLPKDGKYLFVHNGIAAYQRDWEAAGRPPLLTLRSEHADLLRAIRVKWGMKDTDKFVCLHVRSDDFYGKTQEQAQRFRNTPLESYYPLVRALTAMGLWVVRMGNPSMKPLDLDQCGDAARVVDYAVSADRSAELDVALCAQCELFVSSPSGLHTVAHAFGRPVCEVNYPIYNGFPWHSGDIFIPQLYYSHAKRRPLTLAEILGTDVPHLDHQFLLDREGLTLIPNEPDDIVETVREALSPSTYQVEDVALADKVCAHFDDLNRRHNVGISGRLGRYFAMKYASKLMAIDRPIAEPAPWPAPPKGRKLDVLIPCFNRPNYLHRILQTGLAMNVPGTYFVVFDDASNGFEDVPGLGSVTVEMVCRSFNDERVIYTRNPSNMGVAKSLERYYREICDAEYTSLLNPKDEFIDGAPIVNAIAKLDADAKLSFVVYPLRQVDRDESDKPLLFKYNRMTGREFVAAHVRDPMLQHCSGYAVLRVEALRRCGIPRDLDLRGWGLEDASGIDHEMLFNLATTGDVEFESEAPVRRTIVDGYTERFPLTFAYSQYQYARRLMAELEPKGFVTAETRQLYLSFWHLIIARGLVVAYRHVYGSEQERGVARIRPHLTIPILLYLPREAIRFGVWPRRESVATYFVGARLLLVDWLRKMLGRPHIA